MDLFSTFAHWLLRRRWSLATIGLLVILLASCASIQVSEESIVTFGQFVGSFDKPITLKTAQASEAHVFLFSGQEVPNIRGWTGVTLVVVPLSEVGHIRVREILEGHRRWRLRLQARARCRERLWERLTSGHQKLISDVTEGLSLIPPMSSFSVGIGQVRCYVVDLSELYWMPDDAKLAAPPMLPEITSLRRIIVSDSSEKTVLTIEDQAQVLEVLRWINSLDDDWVPPWKTVPHFEYTLNFEASDGAEMVLWLGEGWIGSADSWRHLSSLERKRLGVLLGLSSRGDEALSP